MRGNPRWAKLKIENKNTNGNQRAGRWFCERSWATQREWRSKQRTPSSQSKTTTTKTSFLMLPRLRPTRSPPSAEGSRPLETLLFPVLNKFLPPPPTMVFTWLPSKAISQWYGRPKAPILCEADYPKAVDSKQSTPEMRTSWQAVAVAVAIPALNAASRGTGLAIAMQ